MSGAMTWAEQYAAGSTMKRIAADNGVTKGMVRRAIIAAGGTIRKGGIVTGQRDHRSSWHVDAAAMKAQGMRSKDIAAAVFRSPETVKWALQRLERGL